MQTVQLFQQVKLCRDVPDTIFKKGDQGTIVEYLPPNEQQLEAGYLLEMFDNNETLDVIAVPISWITSIN
ncbi:MAG: DUF4926 domain-containing protein [Microcystis aeruginosa Ma_MB_F_20061100_S20]|uniref:DUF4926 domain-containing protein n=1 Tax=Microcystis aeruginosa Ma_MB_F_20061100_S20D TaxID=2486253 RepID=A0A552E9Z2_MICAE|nr:MAG: DUF4926 domain-containing protein [Microcystis aeruginosa Ma_MB_F_20061100_S20D]TRU41436.1 MAG: DUF4926 domain-containing protein [Microcystis aeruginosa Ma_MB_F_20061100_S20]